MDAGSAEGDAVTSWRSISTEVLRPLSAHTGVPGGNVRARDARSASDVCWYARNTTSERCSRVASVPWRSSASTAATRIDGGAHVRSAGCERTQHKGYHTAQKVDPFRAPLNQDRFQRNRVLRPHRERQRHGDARQPRPAAQIVYASSRFRSQYFRKNRQSPRGCPVYGGKTVATDQRHRPWRSDQSADCRGTTRPHSAPVPLLSGHHTHRYRSREKFGESG